MVRGRRDSQQPHKVQRKEDLRAVREAIEAGETPLADTYDQFLTEEKDPPTEPEI